VLDFAIAVFYVIYYSAVKIFSHILMERQMDITSEQVRKALELSNTQFKRLFGVKKETFHRMLEIMHKAFGELHKQGGKPLTKLQVEDKLLLTLQYWREYRTMEHLAYEYGVVKSAVHSAMVWVENTLVRDGTFRLPGKNCLIAGENKPQTIVIDVTESPIERPKKTAKILFRQKETSYDKIAVDCRSKNKNGVKC
jgi:hypothetical protein